MTEPAFSLDDLIAFLEDDSFVSDMCPSMLHHLRAAQEGERGPALMWRANGEAGDGSLVCLGCDCERDEPHTWQECLAVVRQRASTMLNLALDRDEELLQARAALSRSRAALAPFAALGTYDHESDDETRLAPVRVGDVRAAEREEASSRQEPPLETHVCGNEAEGTLTLLKVALGLPDEADEEALLLRIEDLRVFAPEPGDLRSGKPSWPRLERLYQDAVRIIAEQQKQIENLSAGIPQIGGHR